MACDGQCLTPGSSPAPATTRLPTGWKRGCAQAWLPRPMLELDFTPRRARVQDSQSCTLAPILQDVNVIRARLQAGEDPGGHVVEPLRTISRGADHRCFVGRHEKARLQNRLETVADAENQFFSIAKSAQFVAEEDAELVGENCNATDKSEDDIVRKAIHSPTAG